MLAREHLSPEEPNVREAIDETVCTSWPKEVKCSDSYAECVALKTGRLERIEDRERNGGGKELHGVAPNLRPRRCLSR